MELRMKIIKYIKYKKYMFKLILWYGNFVYAITIDFDCITLKKSDNKLIITDRQILRRHTAADPSPPPHTNTHAIIHTRTHKYLFTYERLENRKNLILPQAVAI